MLGFTFLACTAGSNGVVAGCAILLIIARATRSNALFSLVKLYYPKRSLQSLRSCCVGTGIPRVVESYSWLLYS
jgi:hypothetical protein